ncbi:MAG: hypothetical protein ABJN04_13400 [Hyphomicrobiales bacterium]
MQDRYAGDVGDYVKLALLRSLSEGRKLGVAWYLYPDEGHNEDGKHISYLKEPSKWRHLDPDLFDALKLIANETRSVNAIEESGVLQAEFSSERMVSPMNYRLRSDWRRDWHEGTLDDLNSCDLVFADPDNGMIDDDPKRRTKEKFSKQIPLNEVLKLAENRTAVIYHHNTRFKGGHELEVKHWLGLLGNAIAVRANSYNCRTFFVVNPDDKLRSTCEDFCDRWSKHKVFLQSH